MLKATLLLLAASSLIGSALLAQGQRPNWPGTSRIDLQRHDLSLEGRETLQARINFEPGSFATRHKHPGEEIIYVLEGTLEYQIDGSPPVVLNAGDVLFVPDGVIHRARNVGNVRGAELATYIVRKGMPLTELADPAEAGGAP
jgi:quercetin dioxygenase-like cupin family protein